MEALRDQTIVELVKMNTKDNIADLNSKLLDQVTEKVGGTCHSGRGIGVGLPEHLRA